MTMETAMIKAIREFKKMNIGEIRTVAIWESSGMGNKIDYAMFHVEYCEVDGGEYKSVDVRVGE